MSKVGVLVTCFGLPAAAVLLTVYLLQVSEGRESLKQLSRRSNLDGHPE